MPTKAASQHTTQSPAHRPEMAKAPTGTPFRATRQRRQRDPGGQLDGAAACQKHRTEPHIRSFDQRHHIGPCPTVCGVPRGTCIGRSRACTGAPSAPNGAVKAVRQRSQLDTRNPRLAGGFAGSLDAQRTPAMLAAMMSAVRQWQGTSKPLRGAPASQLRQHRRTAAGRASVLIRQRNVPAPPLSLRRQRHAPKTLKPPIPAPLCHLGARGPRRRELLDGSNHTLPTCAGTCDPPCWPESGPRRSRVLTRAPESCEGS